MCCFVGCDCVWVCVVWVEVEVVDDGLVLGGFGVWVGLFVGCVGRGVWE